MDKVQSVLHQSFNEVIVRFITDTDVQIAVDVIFITASSKDPTKEWKGNLVYLLFLIHWRFLNMERKYWGFIAGNFCSSSRQGPRDGRCIYLKTIKLIDVYQCLSCNSLEKSVMIGSLKITPWLTIIVENCALIIISSIQRLDLENLEKLRKFCHVS